MKKNRRKLSLSKESLVQLTRPDLGRAAGAGWSDDSVCPTVTPTDCRRCIPPEATIVGC
jgi:hypothetical protein